jgi:ribonuclease HI
LESNTKHETYWNTPSSIAGVDICPPHREHQTFYIDDQPINYAEMAAALVTLIWAAKHHQEPTTFSLHTDSTIVYHTLQTGKGATLQTNQLLRELYCSFLK